MEYQLKVLEESDMPRVLVLEKKLFSTPWPREAFQNEIDRKAALVLEIKGRIEGFICWIQVIDEAEITNVAVAKDFQRQGWGQILVTEAMKILKKKGCKNFYLEVRKSNKAARLLYKKMGFELVGLRENYYFKPRENALILGLELNNNRK